MSRAPLEFDFELLDNIQLCFIILLIGLLTYLIVKLSSVLFSKPEQMPRIQRKYLRPRCLANPLVRRRRTEALAARRITALAAERTKEWHRTISNETRHRIVRKLITSTYSTSDIHHRRPLYGPMVSFIRILEANLYKTADSKPEYYQLISEKMNLFRKELKQRRLKRKQLQLLYAQRLPEPQMVLTPELLNFERLSLNDHTVVNMPEEQKEWHDSLPCRSRMYMVDELMMAMLPRPNFPFPLGWDVNHMVDHARNVAKKIEGENFQTANSKGEYYQMMGEKIVAKNKYRNEAEEQMKMELLTVVVPPNTPEEETKIEEV